MCGSFEQADVLHVALIAEVAEPFLVEPRDGAGDAQRSTNADAALGDVSGRIAHDAEELVVKTRVEVLLLDADALRLEAENVADRFQIFMTRSDRLFDDDALHAVLHHPLQSRFVRLRW